MKAKKIDAVIVLDFGGQYCHLIARRVRQSRVYSEVIQPDVTLDEVRELGDRMNVKGLILSGGPFSVYELGSPKIDARILELGIPILGLCYGHQLIANLLGGRVEPGKRREYGVAYINVEKAVGVLKGMGRKEKVWMSHGDIVRKLPRGFEVLAHSTDCPIAAYRHRERAIYGLQWHPEVAHTERGAEMLRNFISGVCKCQRNWRPSSLIEAKVEAVRQAVGRGKAIIALSGGIDSSTAAAIAAKALGNRLTAVFVDHGFMHEGEPKFVEDTFGKLGVDVVIAKAKDRFLKEVKEVADPEGKRKAIGREFVRVFEDVARRIGAKYLIQGTIYPDRIESGFRRYSDKIKSHHNVAGLPTDIEFEAVIEPLRDFYKDEVRELAKALGLPDELVLRQPFPGPGLAVRIVGKVTSEKVRLARKADAIVTDEIERDGLEKNLWQYFAVVTDTKSTGVKGDARAYGYVVAIRAVESREAMTASFARLPYEVLERISTRMTNELPEVTRVVYDVTHKPPATIEWE